MDPQVTAPIIYTGPKGSLLHLSSAYLREARFWRDPERISCGWALRHKTVDATEMAICELFEQLRARNLEHLHSRACDVAFQCASQVLHNNCTQGEAAARLCRWFDAQCSQS